MFTLKHSKTLQLFRSYSDHLQGAHMFLVKVTGFKFVTMVKVNVVMRRHNVM